MSFDNVMSYDKLTLSVIFTNVIENAAADSRMIDYRPEDLPVASEVRFTIWTRLNILNELSGGSRICQRGADHGERAERERTRGSRGRAPSGVQGQSPWWGIRGGKAPLKLKAFCTFLHKKWPKVKDLSENLPPCLSRAVMTSP